MKEKIYLTNQQCDFAARRLFDYWLSQISQSFLKVYGVPRGGIPVAYLVAKWAAKSWSVGIVDSPESANLIVDDMTDSGKTRRSYLDAFPVTPFLTLLEYVEDRNGLRDRTKTWIVFPWENGKTDTSGHDIVLRLLQYIGEDPEREGLKETPSRVLKAWDEWTRGYGFKVEDQLKTFADGGENYDEMVIVRDLPFYSTCEHHLAPFFGTATIAYLPDKKIVGLSKLGRVLEVFSRRLQVQERLTGQIADAIHETLAPKGVGVIIKARHLCMESRGLRTQGHSTVTSALRGNFKAMPVRQEFIALAQS